MTNVKLGRNLNQTRLFRQDRISKHCDPNDVIASVKGEKFREYRKLFHASAKGEINLDFPLDLSIETIDYCNYACPYCPRVIDRGDGTKMSDDVFKKIIDEFAFKTKGLGAVCFDSGEPLLDKSLEEKISYINSLGICDIIVTTNATYLTKARAKSLILAGTTKLHISIDAATQETYTKTRGGKLSFVEQNVHNFMTIRAELSSLLPIVRCSFVKSDLNIHEINAFSDKWAGIVDYVEFQDCVDHSRLDDLLDYEVEPFWCHYPFQSITLNAKGDIRPCCSFYNKHLVFGHISDGHSLEEVFNSEKQSELRRQFKEAKDFDVVCRNCRVAPPLDLEIKSKPLLAEQALPAKGSIPK